MGLTYAARNTFYADYLDFPGYPEIVQKVHLGKLRALSFSLQNILNTHVKNTHVHACMHTYIHTYVYRYLCTVALIRMRVLADLAIFHVLKQHNTDQEPAAKNQKRAHDMFS